MCIRDSYRIEDDFPEIIGPLYEQLWPQYLRAFPAATLLQLCLLYTSDAADERSSVDLGGRRIIKKKKSVIISGLSIVA